MDLLLLLEKPHALISKPGKCITAMPYRQETYRLGRFRALSDRASLSEFDDMVLTPECELCPCQAYIESGMNDVVIQRIATSGTQVAARQDSRMAQESSLPCAFPLKPGCCGNPPPLGPMTVDRCVCNRA